MPVTSKNMGSLHKFTRLLGARHVFCQKTNNTRNYAVLAKIQQNGIPQYENKWLHFMKYSSASSKIDPSKAIGATFPDVKWTYSDNDVMLYALGVGVSTTQNDFLRFLFEKDKNFSVLPTYAVLSSLKCAENGLRLDGLKVDPRMVLHGEQYCEVFQPLPTQGILVSKGEVSDVIDKKSGAVILIDVTSYDENNEKVSFNQVVIFVQKAGGFGGKRSSDRLISSTPVPSRSPDKSVQQQTTDDQAALYRLTGDRNPLHIDPSFSVVGGFPKPILHGLCSLGFSVRHILDTYADNEVSRFKSVKTRFSAPVIPGQTIQTDMWKEDKRIHFMSKVAETDAVVIKDAYVDLYN